MMLQQSFWRNRRVLVTGHTGFKGTWLSLWLKSLGAQVSGYSDNVPTSPSHFDLSRIAERLEHDFRADIRSREELETAFRTVNPEVVFHLAAQPLVSVGYTHPLDTFEVNVNGTLEILETVRQRRTPLILIVVTSDKCYAPGSVLGLRESDPLGGVDPYSASKSLVELLCSSYRDSFFRNSSSEGIRLATVRAGNVIGGGDWAANRLLPDAARQISAGQPLVLRNPDAVRPWQHVLEPLLGYLKLAEAMGSDVGGDFADAWNFGPQASDAITVREVAEQFIESWGDGRLEVDCEQTIGHETAVLRLTIDKAMSRLDWRPVLDVREAISRTAQWYRDYYRTPGMDVSSRSLSEIADFTGSIR